MKKRNVYRSLIIVFTMFLFVVKTYSQENEKAGFEIRYFLDNFGDKTNIPYLYKSVEGRFSNIATTDSKLIVEIIISNIEIGFGLIEYGSSRVKSNDSYVVNFKTANGNVHNILADSVPELARIPMRILPGDMDLSIIFDGASLTKMYIYIENSKVTNYSFSCVFPTINYIRSILGQKNIWYK